MDTATHALVGLICGELAPKDIKHRHLIGLGFGMLPDITNVIFVPRRQCQRHAPVDSCPPHAVAALAKTFGLQHVAKIVDGPLRDPRAYIRF